MVLEINPSTVLLLKVLVLLCCAACKPGCPGEQLHDAAAHTWIYGYCQGKEFPPCLRFLSLPIDHRMFLYSPLANILTTHIHCQFKKDNTHKKNCVNTATCST